MTSRARSVAVAGVGPQALGAAIRGLREERAIRLTDLAKQTALSVSFLSQLERGLTNPSLPSLVRISAALGTSAHALLANLSPVSEMPADPVSPVFQGGEDGAYIDNVVGYARSLVQGRRAIQPMEVVGAPTLGRSAAGAQQPATIWQRTDGSGTTSYVQWDSVTRVRHTRLHPKRASGTARAMDWGTTSSGVYARRQGGSS